MEIIILIKLATEPGSAGSLKSPAISHWNTHTAGQTSESGPVMRGAPINARDKMAAAEDEQRAWRTVAELPAGQRSPTVRARHSRSVPRCHADSWHTSTSCFFEILSRLIIRVEAIRQLQVCHLRPVSYQNILQSPVSLIRPVTDLTGSSVNILAGSTELPRRPNIYSIHEGQHHRHVLGLSPGHMSRICKVLIVRLRCATPYRKRNLDTL
ncbi:hypothetical protein J6590_041922 [Homalodisca vitripennis]|nr:hypothetical protein J6590_041922 [Homalodisca vitripennis]